MHDTTTAPATTTEAATGRRLSVYALLDPRDGGLAVRYVGCTQSALSRRLEQHLAPTKLADTTALAAWLSEVVAAGLTPYVMLLSSVPAADWRAEERAWIARMRESGHNLVNEDAGGGGPMSGYTWSAEGRANLSRAKAGRLRANNTSGYPGISASGRRWRAQLAGANLGTYDTPEEAFAAYRRAFIDKYGRDVPGFGGEAAEDVEGVQSAPAEPSRQLTRKPRPKSL